MMSGDIFASGGGRGQVERRIRTNSMEGYGYLEISLSQNRVSYLNRRISAMPLSVARTRI